MILQVLNNWFLRSNKSERLWLLAKIEFKLRYYENKLGLFWALLKPIMDIGIYYIVFQIIMKQDVPAFASYLFIGLILYNFFIESTSGTIHILNTKKYLYEYSNMNKLEIYISTLMSNMIGFIFNLIMFLVFYSFIEPQSIGASLYNLWIIPIFFSLFIMSLGISLILSNLYIVAKDINQIWQVFATLLMFISPIFYKMSSFTEALPSFDYANPLAGIIINARRVMMQGLEPDFELMMLGYGYAILFLFIGLILLNKLGSKAAEKL
ncbi:ABC transporter permease [Pontibacter liquoris]|uniref:ABC transporter permease n=1 Tax=Pontibacter liquoris TaxID=2905677 RepID=UPI001FA80C40|nr:ABC transporter permease [Pontibacter liquoris]